jgi:hypothetical protein
VGTALTLSLVQLHPQVVVVVVVVVLTQVNLDRLVGLEGEPHQTKVAVQAVLAQVDKAIMAGLALMKYQTMAQAAVAVLELLVGLVQQALVVLAVTVRHPPFLVLPQHTLVVVVVVAIPLHLALLVLVEQVGEDELAIQASKQQTALPTQAVVVVAGLLQVGLAVLEL